jgi:hypothetical protein
VESSGRLLLSRGKFGTICGVNEQEKRNHAAALRKGMSLRRVTQETIATAVGRSKRTVGNWTSETKPTVPTEGEREILRKLLGPYDTAGDQVEVALAHSNLTEDRRYEVLALYKRLLRQQFLDEAM